MRQHISNTWERFHLRPAIRQILGVRHICVLRETVALGVVVVEEAVEVLLSRRGLSCCTERRVALGSAS